MQHSTTNTHKITKHTQHNYSNTHGQPTTITQNTILATIHNKYRVTHGNLTSLEWVVLRTAPKKNKLCQCVVSTRWCHSAHCKWVNVHCSKHVSRAPNFPFWRRAVAPLLSRSFVWFFFFGEYLKSHVYTHKPRTLNDLKEAIRQDIRLIDRQLLARVMDDFKKRLENCIQEDGRHLTDIIFKT